LKFYQRERIIRAAKSLGKITIVGLVAFAILTFIGLQYSAKSEFCKLCHYMLPYYNAWKSSSHNMVPCVECHYPPSVEKELKGKIKALTSVVQYFTGAYGKRRPWVEIDDNSCLREGCHNRRLLSGRSNFGNILFDHTPHLTKMRRGKRLKCTSCHSQIVQREHMTVTTTTCFLCHFKRVPGEKTLDDCDLCHGAPLSPVQYLGVKFDHTDALRRGVECRKCHMYVIQGNGEVFKDRCFSCHTESEKLEKYSDALLMHNTHVTKHKVDCLRCHDEIRHRVLERAQSVEMECTSCHPQQHAAQKELFLGIGGYGVDYMPDPMFLTRVSCTSCHIFHKGDPYRGTTAYSTAAACMSCHGTKYGKILERWRSLMKKNLSIVLPSLSKAQSELSRARRDDGNYREAKKLLKEAKENIDLVRYGKGVHNIKYSANLLNTANSMIQEAMKLIGSSYRPPKLPLSKAALKSECYSCHLGIEWEKTFIFGKRFSHQPHLVKADLKCETCHSNQREHGELIISKGDCLSCHHSEGEANCKKCHQDGPSRNIAYRGLEFAHHPHTVSLGLDCVDCHRVDRRSFSFDPRTDCFTCHHPSDTRGCEECHTLQKSILSGEGVLDYPSISGSMSSLECQNCHPEVKPQENLPIVKATCEMCHGEGYADLVDMWQAQTSEQMEKIKRKITELEGLLKKMRKKGVGKERVEKVATGLREIKKRLNLVENDRSGGVHNQDLILKILKDLELKIDRVKGYSL